MKSLEFLCCAARFWSTGLALALTLGLGEVTKVWSDAPCVQFDTIQAVAGHPVEAVGLQPLPATARSVLGAQDEMLIDVQFDVSTLIRFGRESQIAQLLFVVENPPQSLHVVEFSPRTELTTSYAGNIERSQQQDRSLNAGLNATFAPVDFATAEANASNGSKSSDSVRFQTLPPMELLAASGTAQRGTAVYFKFRSSPQTTLEGNRQLRVMYRVPRSWRADYVYIRCAAFDDTALATDGRAICGSADFLVPVYLAGDTEAYQAARAMAQAESRLREQARRASARPRRSTKSSWTDKLSELVHPAKSTANVSVPPSWLTVVLTSQPSTQQFSFQAALPPELDLALSDFTTARWQLARLNQAAR